ncbi:MAG: mechanosensitive ion channel family protein [Burkholderiales bacterium]|nr:mechanosensitive ion channel family protein [Burkholderiales bacterium]
MRIVAACVGLFLTSWAATAGAAANEPATLSIYNRDVITLRAPLLSYAPAERVAAARRRIEDALDRGGAGEVTLKPHAEGMLVEVDGRTVFAVQPADLDTLGDETLEMAATAARDRLSEAIAAAREAHGAGLWLRAAGWTALGTLIWLAILRLIHRTNRWLGRRVSAAVQERVEHLKVGGVVAVQSLHFGAIVRRTVTIVGWIVGLVATYGWLTFVLERFPFTRPWGEQLEGRLLEFFTHLGLSIVAALPGLFTVVVIVVITRAIIRLVRVFFDRVEAGEIRVGWLDAELARPTRRIVNVVLWLFALAMAYPYLPGANTDAFKGLSVLVGLMISIGASSIVAQAASGLILMYSRAFRVGEFVKIGDAEGTVAELTLFATRVRTGLSEEVVLPNAYVLSNVSRNFSRAAGSQGFTLHAKVTIGYDTPWRQVHAMLLAAAGRTVGVLTEPAPYVIQTGLSDFYVEYVLVVIAGSEAPRMRAEAMSALYSNIQDVFNEHGVQIMSPHYLEDPAQPKVVPEDRWYEAPAQPPTKPAL